MPKSTTNYWNPLSPDNSQKWNPIPGFEGVIEELTLSQDQDSGAYTRLTRFHAGADTTSLGEKSHDYPEEIFIVSGHIYDQAFDIWLESGYYASRPPGEIHGLILDVLFWKYHFQIELNSWLSDRLKITTHRNSDRKDQ